MDSTLKQMLESFKFSIKNYSSSLGPNNAKLNRAGELVEKLWEKASSGASMTELTMDPLFAETAGLIGQLASEPPLAPNEIEEMVQSGQMKEGDDIPPASIPAGGYHMAFDSLPPEQKKKQQIYYEKIFRMEEEAENAIHFNTLLMEDTVLLDMSRIPLIESAEETLLQAKSAYSPTVNYQQKLAIETWQRVRTIPELEFEGTKMAELSNTEHQWDALYLEVIGLLPGCAQAIEAFGPLDGSIAKLRNSHKFMVDFMGITWEDVFRNSRYMLFWNNVLWPKVPEPKRVHRSAFTAEAWRDMLKNEFYDPFVKDMEPVKSDPDKAVVRLWEKEFPSSRVLELLENPPRPDINP